MLFSRLILFLALSLEIVTTLKGHTGLVKGLTWDPVGKYIASQADDHSLKVWRTMDWQLETNITKPFNEVMSLMQPGRGTYQHDRAVDFKSIRLFFFHNHSLSTLPGVYPQKHGAFWRGYQSTVVQFG